MSGWVWVLGILIHNYFPNYQEAAHLIKPLLSLIIKKKKKAVSI